MPSYKVEYTADKRPTDLPANAEVKQVSALPAKVTAIHGLGKSLPVTISGGVCDRRGATLEFGDYFDPAHVELCLSRENVDTLIEALTEARGTDKSVPAKKAPKRDVEYYENSRTENGVKFRIHANQSAMDPEALYLSVSKAKVGGTDGDYVYTWLTKEETQGLYRVLKEIHGDA